MSKRTSLLAIGLLLAAALPLTAGPVQPLERDEPQEKHEHGDWGWDEWKDALADFFVGPETRDEFRWTGSLAQGRALEIKGVNGRISVSAASGDTVELDAVKRGRRSDPKQVEIAIVEHSGGVTICAVYPSATGGPANECVPGKAGRMKVRNNDVAVDFEIKLPAGRDLVARTVNGSVRVDGVGGDVQAHTVNGVIHAKGIAGNVEAQTVNGSVRLEARGTARAETVNGSIVADLGRADWRDSIEFETVNGSVEVSLPAEASAEIHVTTSNGRIRNAFELARTEKSTRRELRGTIGGGGRELRIRTVNGGVRLERHGAAEARLGER